MTYTISIAGSDESLVSAVEQLGKRHTHVYLERDGVRVAAVVSLDDAGQLEELERQRAEDFAYLADVQKTFDDVDPAEHFRETARAVREAKVRLRARRAATGETAYS